MATIVLTILTCKRNVHIQCYGIVYKPIEYMWYFVCKVTTIEKVCWHDVFCSDVTKLVGTGQFMNCHITMHIYKFTKTVSVRAYPWYYATFIWVLFISKVYWCA